MTLYYGNKQPQKFYYGNSEVQKIYLGSKYLVWSKLEHTHANAAEMISDSSLAVGDRVVTSGYHDTDDGGGNEYEIVTSGTGTADKGSYLNLNNGLQAKGLFPGDEYRLEQFGARADGSTDDAEAWRNLMAVVPSGKTTRFSSGKTYLLSAGCDIQNDDSVTPGTEVRSFNIIATGATIILKEFTGTELLQIFHTPKNVRDPWTYSPWDLSWTGGTIDSNGYKQHDRFSVMYRDGTGTLAANKVGNVLEAANSAATAKVFGPGGKFEIDSRVTDKAGKRNNWLLRIQGARNVTVTGVTTKNRIRDGLVVRDAHSYTVRNCKDEHSLPTNDQFSIFTKDGGNTGTQHFAWSTSKSRTTGTLTISFNGLSGLNVGDEIVGDVSGLHAFVSSVSSNKIKVYHVYGYDRDFSYGETFSVNGTPTNATIDAFSLGVAGQMLVENCEADIGCSGVGFMATQEPPRFTSLTVRDCVFKNMTTVAVRNEKAQKLVIENCTFFNNHILSDPTGQVFYGSQAAINVANATEDYTIRNCSVVNAQIDGGNGSFQYGGLMDTVDVEVTDRIPVISSDTGKESKINAIEIQIGTFKNVTVSSERTSAGVYPIGIAMESNSGSIEDCHIDGAHEYGIRTAETVRGTTIKNVTGAAIANSTASSTEGILFENLIIENVGIGLNPQARHTPSLPCVVRNVQMTNVQGNCFRLNDPDMDTALVENCTFTNFGLDTLLSQQERAAIGGPIGFRADSLIVTGTTFAANVSDASTIKTALHKNNNSDFVETNSTELPTNKSFTNISI